MADIGRPGPFAVFRDKTGLSSWSRYNQQGKYSRVWSPPFNGSLRSSSGGSTIFTEEIEYTQPDTHWAYTWVGGAGVTGGPISVRVLMELIEHGTQLRVETDITGVSVTAHAVSYSAPMTEWRYFYDNSVGDWLYTPAGWTSSDHGLIVWPSPTDVVTFGMQICPWGVGPLA